MTILAVFAGKETALNRVVDSGYHTFEIFIHFLNAEADDIEASFVHAAVACGIPAGAVHRAVDLHDKFERYAAIVGMPFRDRVLPPEWRAHLFVLEMRPDTLFGS